MPEPTALRRGVRGEAVRDLQARLGALGLGHEPDEPGTFGPATEQAVRSFQQERGLQVDGIIGHHTWESLVESGFSLGDRLLYLRHPMLRGDDVATLQRQLNALGFDTGRVDGIHGINTHRALTDFQRSLGLVADGVCGPGTISSLGRVGMLADGSVATARERDELRHGPPGLEGRRIFVATTPGLGVVGDALVREFTGAGAETVVDSSGDDESILAQAANGFGADLFVAFRSGTAPSPHCAYFETAGFHSETGRAVAGHVCQELGRALARRVDPAGRAYPLLRETRMAAVVCELVTEGDAIALAEIVRRAGDVARAVVRGARRTFEGAAERR